MDQCSLQVTELPAGLHSELLPEDENPGNPGGNNSHVTDNRPSSENISEDSGDVDMEYVDAHEPDKRSNDGKCSLPPDNLMSVLPFFSSSNHFGMNNDKIPSASEPSPLPTSSTAPPRSTMLQMKVTSGNVQPNMPMTKDLFNLMTIDTGINFASICTSIGTPSEATKRDRYTVELTNQINKQKTELNNAKDEAIKKDKIIKELALEYQILEDKLHEERLSMHRTKKFHCNSFQAMFTSVKKEQARAKFVKLHYSLVREENLHLMGVIYHMKKQRDELMERYETGNDKQVGVSERNNAVCGGNVEGCGEKEKKIEETVTGRNEDMNEYAESYNERDEAANHKEVTSREEGVSERNEDVIEKKEDVVAKKEDVIAKKEDKVANKKDENERENVKTVQCDGKGYQQFTSIDLQNSEVDLHLQNIKNPANSPQKFTPVGENSSPSVKELENPTGEPPNDVSILDNEAVSASSRSSLKDYMCCRCKKK